jgi:hypothetical protein
MAYWGAHRYMHLPLLVACLTWGCGTWFLEGLRASTEC